MNAQVNPLMANILNIHAAISAECRTSALAVQSPSEVYTDDRPVCVIIPDSITYREDDRNVTVYDVWEGQTIVCPGCKTYIEAATWANENNYRIESLR